MRFWISKNNEASIREQLVRQVILGILSEDLPWGQKLPSVRALARRHRIHPNTVSAAYQHLTQEGWLEVRHGSGLYVRRLDSQSSKEGRLDQLLKGLLEAAKSQGYESGDVLQRLNQLLQPEVYRRILVIEPESAMREILHKEIAPHVLVPVDTVARFHGDVGQLEGTLVVALPTRAIKLRSELPEAVQCVALRLRSVEASLENSARPESDMVVTIVSRSSEVRRAARTMMLAVGLNRDSLCEIDASNPGWKDRLTQRAFVVTDVAIAIELPTFCRPNVFRLIADSSIAELKRYIVATSGPSRR